MAPRILMVHPGPDFSVADVFKGWKGALEKLLPPGHVAMYNTNDRLAFYSQAALRDWSYTLQCAACGQYRQKTAFDSVQATTLTMQGLSHAAFTFWPDVLIFISAFYSTAALFELLRMRNMKIVLIHTESPYQDEEQATRGQFADLNIINDPMNLDEWRQLDAPAYYVPHAYRPEVHYPQPAGVPYEAEQSDFAFVGTAFPTRIAFLEQMDFSGLEIALGGNAWDSMGKDSPLLRYLGHPVDECVENDETARVYRASRAGINFYRREGEKHSAYDGYAMGPREVEMAACGLPYLRDWRPENEEIFPFLPSFTTPADATEKLRWLLADENRRLGLAEKARAAIAERTFDNHAAWLLREMEAQGLY